MNQKYGKCRSIAGGLFDVHKHLVLTCVLEELKLHTKRFHYIDAHAGSGLYDLVDQGVSINNSIGVKQLINANKNEIGKLLLRSILFAR